MHFKALLSTAVLFSTYLTATLANADATSGDLDVLMKTAGLGTGPSELNEEALGRYLELKAVLFPTPTTTTPVKRAEEYEIQKLSNAERLARGLPLRAPARRRHSKVFARNPAASPGPRTTLTGRAALYRDDLGGAFFGYVDRTFIGSNQARYTTNAADAMILSVSFDSLQTKSSQLQVLTTNAAIGAGFPFLCLTQGRDNTNTNLASGSFHYTYLSVAAVSAGPGPAGTTSNAYNSLTGASRIAQTDIWNFDRTTKVLSPTWINAGGQSVDVPFYSQSTAIYGMGDHTSFFSRYPSPVTGSFTLKLEVIESAPSAPKHAVGVRIPPGIFPSLTDNSPSPSRPPTLIHTPTFVIMHLKSILSAAVLFSSFFAAFAVDTTPVDLHELMAEAGVTGGESEYDEAAYIRYLNAKNELLPTPTRRDEGAEYVESLSNAQRLAKGLPLKAPARRQPSRIWNRDAAASPLPRETVTGRAALYNQNGERVFYVNRNLNTAGFTSLTTDVDNALTLSVSFDTLQPVFAKIQVTMLNLATSGFPLLSLIQGRDDTNTDMTAGSFHYTYLGGAAEPGSGPGSTGSSTIGNTYTDRTGLSRAAQTDIWTYDPATTVLAPTWINSNNDNVEIPFYSQSNGIYGLKDSDAFHTRYPGAPVIGPFTLKLEPIV